MTPKDPFLGGDFLGQILAADSLPGAFVHSRRSVPKTLAFALCLHLRSKTQRSKTRVLGEEVT